MSLEENILIEHLSNGSVLLSKYIEQVESVVIGIYFDCGSRCEIKGEEGISHFIEHMFFKGTLERNSKKVVEDIEDIGGMINAYTSRDSTSFQVKTLYQEIDIGFEVLSDILQNSTFNPQEINKEQHIIMQELKQSLDDNEDLIFELLYDEAYNTQSLGHSILGRAETILSFDQEKVKDFVAKYYNSSNMLISVVGKFDKASLLHKLNLLFKSRGGSTNLLRGVNKYSGGKRILFKENLEQSHIVLGYEGCSYKSVDYYSYMLLSDIIGGGMSSRLFYKLREEEALVYNTYSMFSSYEDTGIFAMYGACDHGDITRIHDTFTEQLAQISQNGVSDKELTRAKKQAISSLIMRQESLEELCEFMSNSYLRFKKIKTQKEIIAKIEKVSNVDLKRIANIMLAKDAVLILLTDQKNSKLNLVE